jgi:hypothetical protein
MRPAGGPSDVVNGGEGNDELLGGVGKPATLDGGPGDDHLMSEEGSDTLIGGEGLDRVRGTSKSTVDCQGRDDEIIPFKSKVHLLNCITEAPTFSVKALPVKPKRLATRGMPFTVACDRPCTAYWTLAPDRRVLAMLHHCCLLAGFGVVRDDLGFPVFATGPLPFVAGVHGVASQKVVKRQRSMVATLVVNVFGHTGAIAQKTLKLKLR